MRITKKWLIILLGIFITLGAVIGLAFGINRVGNRLVEYDDTPADSLPVSLSTAGSFDPSLLSGYDECSNFVSDLEEMAKYMANVHIERMSRQYYHDDYFTSMPRGGWGRGGVVMMEDTISSTTSSDTSTKSRGSDQSSSNTGESSYGTNNQVEGVDEADVVKSDGTHVYAAYGNAIVVWDAATGTEVSRTVVPTADDNGIPLCNNESTSATATDPGVVCYENNKWQMLSIASLLLYEDRVTAVVQSNYRIRDTDDYYNAEDSVLYGSHATRLFVYDTTIPTDNGAPLTLLAQKDIQGYYQSARLINSHAHVVTSSGINTWYHLYQHLNPLNFVGNAAQQRRKLSSQQPYYYDGPDLKGMTENMYKNAANGKALELIPEFAKKLAEEALGGGGGGEEEDCRRIVRLMLYAKQNKQTDDGGDEVVVPFTTAGALSNFAQVTSFDILATPTTENTISKLSTSSSGVFVPFNSYSNSIYSSTNTMIIAGEAYQENSSGVYEEKTVLFAFRLTPQGKSRAVSIGVVPGSLLNQFSMDHYDYDGAGDYLRVATTSWGQWGMIENTGRWGQTEESRSQVTVLGLPSSSSSGGGVVEDDPTSMEVVGKVENLGRGERIYAVRFLGTRAFVVTFRQIDPFYTLDMNDPTDPKLVGELKIPGFSNYLHPIGDGTLILAVGQDANDQGTATGLAVAMYDVSNFTNPTQTKKFSQNKGSNSAAQYDHQAFRYLPETEVLILPVSRWAYEGNSRFDGFVVYDVAVDPDKEIGVRFEISHLGEGMARTCWSRSHLTARSMVFEGDMTTMKGHTVLSHDLGGGGREWMLNLDADNRGNECGSW